ncbi:MAG: transposase [bacterium]|nr:transposase [bacterium]
MTELGIRRGHRPKDWGWGTMNEDEWGAVRLVSVYEREAKEPWYLATNLSAPHPAQIVRLYKRRMWIEAAFRDLKNRNWGMGMDLARLTKTGRLDRHFIILAVAYMLLFAFGAAAESAGLADQLKANTTSERVLSLARIGNCFLQTA